MTEEAQRIAFAKDMRWQKAPYNDTDYYVPMLGKQSVACDPLHDLNATNEAEKTLPTHVKFQYDDWLRTVCDNNFSHTISATAAQRWKAFLRTKGLWVD